MVLVPTPMAVAEGAREKGVFPTAITPPGVNVWEPITKSPTEFAVKVVEPRWKVGAGGPSLLGDGDKSSVLAPMTTALPEGVSDTGVPLYVTGAPPGRIVCDPTYTVLSEMEKGMPPSVMAALTCGEPVSKLRPDVAEGTDSDWLGPAGFSCGDVFNWVVLAGLGCCGVDPGEAAVVTKWLSLVPGLPPPPAERTRLFLVEVVVRY